MGSKTGTGIFKERLVIDAAGIGFINPPPTPLFQWSFIGADDQGRCLWIGDFPIARMLNPFEDAPIPGTIVRFPPLTLKVLHATDDLMYVERYP